VRLDADRGVLSFFLDGMKYGEHVCSDLGAAFDNLTAAGPPRVAPVTLFPVFGFRKAGDCLTLTDKWLSAPGTHPLAQLQDAAAAAALLRAWEQQGRLQAAAYTSSTSAASSSSSGSVDGSTTSAAAATATATEAVVAQQQQQQQEDALPQWLYSEAFADWARWRQQRWRRVTPRALSPPTGATAGAAAGSHTRLDLDCSPLACAAACLRLGLSTPLFAGDAVRVAHSCGRSLDAPELVRILGAHSGKLYYAAAGGGSGEGGAASDTPWCWGQGDLGGESPELVKSEDSVPAAVRGVLLGRLPVHRGGQLKVVYPGGAVLRDGIAVRLFESIYTKNKFEVHSSIVYIYIYIGVVQVVY
jgi:hypothetical protein